MDYTTKLILGVSALGALLLVWAVWKFFTSLLKHVLIALALAAVGAGGYWSRMRSQPNPAIGKHAYLRDNGRYLGVVEGAGDDAQRGEVWAIRPPGGYPKMYGRGRVVLKDKYEPPPSPSPEPSPSPSPPPPRGKKGAPGGR